MQYAVIRALVERGQRVAVGFEMFPASEQDNLEAFARSEISESEFLKRTRFQSRWGAAFDFYRPIFSIVQEKQLAVAALNVSREVTSRWRRGDCNRSRPCNVRHYRS